MLKVSVFLDQEEKTFQECQQLKSTFERIEEEKVGSLFYVFVAWIHVELVAAASSRRNLQETK